LSQHKEQQGFLTFAINTPQVDYGRLSYLQCLNVKATQRANSYAVIVDEATYNSFSNQQLNAFDYVIRLPEGFEQAPFTAEPYAFSLTPFKETIKLESDLLFTRSIDHWWTAFRLRDVCLSTGAKTYLGLPSAVRKYRQLFDANSLPDVYNGLMYFRYTKTAKLFFDLAGSIFRDWDGVKIYLKDLDLDLVPTTDVVYALTALILGEESVSIPSLDFINFVHMKSGFNGWSDVRSWLDTVMHERDGDIIRINNLNQYDPVHYYDKTYATKELIEYYEQRVLAGS
jgi:hypothetical protein